MAQQSTQSTSAGPSIRHSGGPVVRRSALWMHGAYVEHALGVKVPSQVTVDLNRSCTSFDAVAGLDDFAMPTGGAIFSVEGDDGDTLWSSGPVNAGDAPVKVHAPLSGQSSIRLVVTRAEDDTWSLISMANLGSMADWAQAKISC